MRSIICVTLFVLVFSACSTNDEYGEGLIRVDLQSMSPSDDVRGIRWSPKGKKLPLSISESAMITNLSLGLPDVAPIALRMRKSEKSDYFDLLDIDGNRDGEFGGAGDTILHTEVNERRGKYWSSFACELSIPFADNDFHDDVVNPYSLSFWYVEDPTEENAEQVLRFSRRSWMQGEVESEYGKILVLLAESEMDGVYDRHDSWALATDSVPADLYNSKHSKSLGNHTWFGNTAFGVDSVLPSGRIVWIKEVDPQISRAEEEKAADWLAPDRAAKRSGQTVTFLHDYKQGMELAASRNQTVLLDFETTWCGPCKQMDQWVYTADTIANATKNMVCIKIDGDEHKDLVKKYQVSGYPTLIILLADGSEKKRASGYQSVANLLNLLKL